MWLLPPFFCIGYSCLLPLCWSLFIYPPLSMSTINFQHCQISHLKNCNQTFSFPLVLYSLSLHPSVLSVLLFSATFFSISALVLSISLSSFVVTLGCTNTPLRHQPCYRLSIESNWCHSQPVVMLQITYSNVAHHWFSSSSSYQHKRSLVEKEVHTVYVAARIKDQ